MNEIVVMYSSTTEADDVFLKFLKETIIAKPPYLKDGDKVVILSPAGAIDDKWVDGAESTLTSWGLDVIVSDFAKSKKGRFAGSDEQRLAEFNKAITDPNVKAIFCSRGGYGAVRIVDDIDWAALVRSPKWIIGYSDITLLHSAANKAGVASLHAPMAQHLAKNANDVTTEFMKNILFGVKPVLTFSAKPIDRKGEVEAEIVGGNLAVMTSMGSTKYEFDYTDKILFIEEIAEPAYKIERMLYQLKLSGVFSRIKGLIVGQMTDCPDDSTMGITINEIISKTSLEVNGPVCFDFPIGHVVQNYSIVEGGRYRFKVDDDTVSLDFIG